MLFALYYELFTSFKNQFDAGNIAYKTLLSLVCAKVIFDGLHDMSNAALEFFKGAIEHQYPVDVSTSKDADKEEDEAFAPRK